MKKRIVFMIALIAGMAPRIGWSIEILGSSLQGTGAAKCTLADGAKSDDVPADSIHSRKAIPSVSSR